MPTFKRDFTRYLVAKRSDATLALEVEEFAELKRLLEKVDRWRVDSGRHPIECVVVEAHWPEYNAVWQMIESRCSRPT